MNERIRELALEAFQPINNIASEGIADRHTFNQAWFQLYNQKFAELIVRECADTVLGFHNQFGDSAHNEIRQHFGVEEK